MGCGATKVQVVEQDPVLSSEDKTDDCRFFCPLCMLFYESKVLHAVSSWVFHRLDVSFCCRRRRNAEGELLRSVHMHWVRNGVHERCASLSLSLAALVWMWVLCSVALSRSSRGRSGAPRQEH